MSTERTFHPCGNAKSQQKALPTLGKLQDKGTERPRQLFLKEGHSGTSGGPVAQTPASTQRASFHPWSGNQILHATTKMLLLRATSNTQCSQINTFLFLKEGFLGSLVVKNLLCNTGTLVQSLAQGKSHAMGATKPMGHNFAEPKCATTEACVPRAPCSTMRSHCNEEAHAPHN